MFKQIICYLLLCFLIITNTKVVHGQSNDTTIFVPEGNPVLVVFSNFSTSVGDDDRTSFEVRRAYLGYNQNIHPNYSIKVVVDIGSPLDDSPFSRLKRYAYFKTASLTYKKNDLTFRAGIIDLLNVGTQEYFWDRRYIFKSYMDEYRFGPRADIGINAEYQFGPFIKADIMLMNGEGYDQMQNDNTYKASGGITLYPVSGLVTRIYGEYSHKKIAETLLAFFVGFDDGNRFKSGAEANFRFSEDFVKHHNRFGYSVYSSLRLVSNISVLARYDWVSSNIPVDIMQPWNLGRDGSALIAGIEHRPVKQVRISINYQDWFPAAQNMTNQRGIFVNLEFRL
jgi:hypothetical protein